MRCDGCGHERQDGSPVCDVESCPCRCHLPNLRRARIRMAAAHWPHLLARVLYVPGMCAAISGREWEEGAEDGIFSAGSPDGAEHALCACRPYSWPSWAVRP